MEMGLLLLLEKATARDAIEPHRKVGLRDTEFVTTDPKTESEFQNDVKGRTARVFSRTAVRIRKRERER